MTSCCLPIFAKSASSDCIQSFANRFDPLLTKVLLQMQLIIHSLFRPKSLFLITNDQWRVAPVRVEQIILHIFLPHLRSKSWPHSHFSSPLTSKSFINYVNKLRRESLMSLSSSSSLDPNCIER